MKMVIQLRMQMVNPIGEIDFSLPVHDPSVAKTDFDELLKNVSTNRPLKPSSSFSDRDGSTASNMALYEDWMNAVLGSYANNGKNFMYNEITGNMNDEGMYKNLAGVTSEFHLVYYAPYNPLKVNITESDTNKKSLGNDTSFNLKIASSNATVTSELPDLVKNLSDKSVVLSSANDEESYYDVSSADGKVKKVPLTSEILQGYEKDGISFTNSGKSIATAIIRDLALIDVNDEYAG